MRRRQGQREQTEQIRIPVVAETVTVDRRTRPVERVRVRKHVVEEHVPVEVISARDDIDVERVSIDREVTSVPQPRVEGDTTIVPVVEERVVVERRLVLKEEIRMTRRRTEHRRVVDVPVKREQVNIERELANSELWRRSP